MTFLQHYKTIEAMYYCLKRGWRSRDEMTGYIERNYGIEIASRTFSRYLDDLRGVFRCKVEYNPSTFKYHIEE